MVSLWEIEKKYFRMLKAITNCQDIIKAATLALNGMSPGSAEVDGKFSEDKLPIRVVVNDDTTVILFNPLPYSRRDVHCISVNSPRIAIVTTEDIQVDQEIHPVIKTNSATLTAVANEFELCFEAEMLPFGFKSFKLKKVDDLNNLVTISSNVKLNLSSDFEFRNLNLNSGIELTNDKISALVNANNGLLQSVAIGDSMETAINVNFFTYKPRDRLQSKYYSTVINHGLTFQTGHLLTQIPFLVLISSSQMVQPSSWSTMILKSFTSKENSVRRLSRRSLHHFTWSTQLPWILAIRSSN